jgi:hypothetical protein
MFDDSDNTMSPSAMPEAFDRDESPMAEASDAGNTVTSSRTRYRESAMSWLALGALLAAWHMEARMERVEGGGSPRMAVVRSSSPRGAHPAWFANSERSWIARASSRASAVAVSALAVEKQPSWSAHASPRTARRWLGWR